MTNGSMKYAELSKRVLSFSGILSTVCVHITNVVNKTYRDDRVGLWADDQQSDLAGSHNAAERCP